MNLKKTKELEDLITEHQKLVQGNEQIYHRLKLAMATQAKATFNAYFNNRQWKVDDQTDLLKANYGGTVIEFTFPNERKTQRYFDLDVKGTNSKKYQIGVVDPKAKKQKHVTIAESPQVPTDIDKKLDYDIEMTQKKIEEENRKAGELAAATLSYTFENVQYNDFQDLLFKIFGE